MGEEGQRWHVPRSLRLGVGVQVQGAGAHAVRGCISGACCPGKTGSRDTGMREGLEQGQLILSRRQPWVSPWQGVRQGRACGERSSSISAGGRTSGPPL